MNYLPLKILIMLVSFAGFAYGAQVPPKDIPPPESIKQAQTADVKVEKENKDKPRSPLMFNIDLYGGYALTKVEFQNDLGDDNVIANDPSKGVGGGLAGLRFGITFPNTIILKSQIFIGLEYINRSYDVRIYDRDIESDAILIHVDSAKYEAKFSVNLQYITIPFGYKMFVKWFFLEAGMNGRFMVCQSNLKTLASGSVTSESLRKDFNAGNDFGIFFGIGVAIPLIKYLTLDIGIRGEFGVIGSIDAGPKIDQLNPLAFVMYGGLGFRVF